MGEEVLKSLKHTHHPEWLFASFPNISMSPTFIWFSAQYLPSPTNQCFVRSQSEVATFRIEQRVGKSLLRQLTQTSLFCRWINSTAVCSQLEKTTECRKKEKKTKNPPDEPCLQLRSCPCRARHAFKWTGQIIIIININKNIFSGQVWKDRKNCFHYFLNLDILLEKLPGFRFSHASGISSRPGWEWNFWARLKTRFRSCFKECHQN